MDKSKSKKLKADGPNIKVESWDEFSQKRKSDKIEKARSSGKKEEPEYKKKENSVKYSIRDGLFTSIKSGLTSSFVMPFAIALNATTSMLALLSSVPGLVAAFLQLFSQDSLVFLQS